MCHLPRSFLTVIWSKPSIFLMISILPMWCIHHNDIDGEREEQHPPEKDHSRVMICLKTRAFSQHVSLCICSQSMTMCSFYKYQKSALIVVGSPCFAVLYFGINNNTRNSVVWLYATVLTSRSPPPPPVIPLPIFRSWPYNKKFITLTHPNKSMQKIAKRF